MLAYTFLFAILLVALTVKAWTGGQPADAQSLLFFAGTVTICALFALKSPRHGYVGATVVALLLIFTSAGRVYAVAEAQNGSSAALVVNGGALLLSLAYLMLAHGTWRKYQRKMAIEAMEKEDNESQRDSAP